MEQRSAALTLSWMFLWRRARLQRAAISLAAAAALLARADNHAVRGRPARLAIGGIPIVALFISCMVAIIASLVCFMRDIDLSLHALAVELEIEDAELNSRTGSRRHRSSSALARIARKPLVDDVAKLGR